MRKLNKLRATATAPSGQRLAELSEIFQVLMFYPSINSVMAGCSPALQWTQNMSPGKWLFTLPRRFYKLNTNKRFYGGASVARAGLMTSQCWYSQISQDIHLTDWLTTSQLTSYLLLVSGRETAGSKYILNKHWQPPAATSGGAPAWDWVTPGYYLLFNSRVCVSLSSLSFIAVTHHTFPLSESSNKSRCIIVEGFMVPRKEVSNCIQNIKVRENIRVIEKFNFRCFQKNWTSTGLLTTARLSFFPSRSTQMQT